MNNQSTFCINRKMKFFLILAACILAVNAARDEQQQCASMRSGRKAPRVVTTTTTYLDDLEDDVNESRSRGCSSKLHSLLNEMVSSRDASLIQSTWETLKKDGDFAPKVFLRYFKAAPESQRMFPRFANVPLSDLPTNSDFLLQAYTCVSSVNSIAKHYNRSSGCPEGCPVLSGLRNKYNAVDFKKLSTVWMNTLQEELGSQFTTEARTAWENVLKVASIYITNTSSAY